MKKTIILLLLFGSCVATAQRFKVLSGELENLKGISEYNVIFDYAGLVVHGFESEDAYLKERAEAGKHDSVKAAAFLKNWYGNRKSKYEPKFIEYFNKRFENKEISVGENTGAKYTMEIKTKWIYPGYNVVAGVEPAKITAVITVRETLAPEHVLVSVEFVRSIGLEPDQFDFDQGYRIAGAYEKLAKMFSMQLRRFL